MRRGMKRGALGSGATLQQLDALLPLLARALASRHAAAASLALRCLCHAVRLPLPGALLPKSVRACEGFLVSRANAAAGTVTMLHSSCCAVWLTYRSSCSLRCWCSAVLHRKSSVWSTHVLAATGCRPLV